MTFAGLLLFPYVLLFSSILAHTSTSSIPGLQDLVSVLELKIENKKKDTLFLHQELSQRMCQNLKNNLGRLPSVAIRISSTEAAYKGKS